MPGSLPDTVRRIALPASGKDTIEIDLLPAAVVTAAFVNRGGRHACIP